VPEERKQDDHRDWHAQQPKQYAATHGWFLSDELPKLRGTGRTGLHRRINLPQR
jgi:hypothetical protein